MCTGTCASAAAAAAAPGSCLARSGPEAATVVELYTSEGCSSCPPADRWLSALKGRPDVLALAFHVDYWDALGWPDRFASPEHTRRQRAQMRPSGARFIYTPQVLAHGLDWRWRERPLPRRTPSMIDLHVSWDGRTARAQVQPVPGGPQLLSAYWAVLEDGLATRVGAGENRGAHLRHDHVVREYQPVAAWRASDATPRQPNAEGQASARSHSLTWVPQALEGQRRLVLVVNDAETGRPLNALALRCP
jgi:hypothetical protein